MKHQKFHYHNIQDVVSEAQMLQAFLPLNEDVSALYQPLQIGTKSCANRIAFQPMEGTDGLEDGTPGELTWRRYERFAKGGAGLIWFEAVATVPEGRASAHQLMLTDKNLDAYKRLVVVVMQATNSGRYSKPTGKPDPLIAYHCPPLEDPLLNDSHVLTDDQLKRYTDVYENAAKLSQAAGFDGIDVKCCHRYLACELLSAFLRPGMYGGSYENRTRFLKDAFRAAQAGMRGGFLTSRMNVYDGFVYPYGFGVNEDSLEVDLTEPIRLIGELIDEFHIPVLNVTMGNPYKNPHVNRPYDNGNYVPDEHPIEGLSRMMKGLSQIQHTYPELPVIGSAFSYLRQFAPALAAGMVSGGHCAMAGFGRMAFANPDFVNQLRENGKVDKVCMTCGGCAQLLRAGTPAGCIIHDREVYKL